MKKSVLFLLFVFSFLCVMTSATFAIGTSAGTTISNQVFLKASNAADTQSTIIDTQVAAVYGETTADAIGGSTHANTVLIGETAYIIYQVFNTGNTSDSYRVQIGNLQYLGGASNWTHAIVDKTGVEKGLDFIIGPIAENGSETFSVRISASSLIAEAPNGSQAYCTVAVYAYNSTFTDTYTGDNGTVYATNNTSAIWIDSAIVSAAVFSVTKVCTGATLAGVASQPRPGATLWYEITYNNIGSAAGVNVYIYDQIDSVNTVIADTMGSDASWTFYYSTLDAPTPVFGGGGQWTAGALPADKTTVKWIKWDKASVASSETSKLRYSVIIK